MALITPFRSGTLVAVTRGDDTQGKAAPGAYGYDFTVLGNGDYTVLSMAEGFVLSVAVEAGLGLTVRTQNSDGTYDIYSNLAANSNTVSAGDQIQVGQALGAAGSTGITSYTKLHFERRTEPTNPASNIAVDFVDDPSPSATVGLPGTIAGEAWESTTISVGPASTPRVRGYVDLTSDLRTNSLVFDAAYYLSEYADIRDYYGANNLGGALSHWRQFGVSEGRRGSYDFDPSYYLQANADVAAAYGSTNYAGAISHWLRYGLDEVRATNQDMKPIYYQAPSADFQNGYGGDKNQFNLSFVIFDANYYLLINPDVKNFYGINNYDGARFHWLRYGISEGRRASTAFNAGFYLQNNPDVARYYGAANYQGAIQHFITFGINEGRQGSAEVNPSYYLALHSDVEQAYGERNFHGALTHYYSYGLNNGWSGADAMVSPSAFSVDYYLGLNPNVVALTAGPNQQVEAIRHWYYLGIDAGLRASSEFDAKYYLAANPDVRASVGSTNYRGALQHFVTTGQAQGRPGADDRQRIFTINPSASVTEGDSGTKTLSFTVTLNHVYGEDIQVDYATKDGIDSLTAATAGSDYTGVTGSLTFAAGETSKTISIDITGDLDCEYDEEFIVELSNPTGGAIVDSAQAQAVGTIINNDPPTITLAIDQNSVFEDGNSDLVYTFSRTGPAVNELIVNYVVAGSATLGTDYTGIDPTNTLKTVTFAAGSATATVTVDPTSDPLFEQDETVTLALAPATITDEYIIGTSLPVSGTILNDDKPFITLGVSASTALEDNGKPEYTFSRDGDTSSSLVVKFNAAGSAIYTTDYQQTGATTFTTSVGSVTFAPGSATVMVTITPVKDQTPNEPDQTVSITLASDPAYNIVTTDPIGFTITDDDVVSAQTYTMVEGKDSSLVLTGTDRINGNGNSFDNIITGNSGINRLSGGKGADTLTGGLDQDFFLYSNLNESQLGANNSSYDIILDYTGNGSTDYLILPSTVSVKDLNTSSATIPSLSESNLAASLNAGSFLANAVTAFKVTGIPGTFIAANDSRPGFQADSDLIISLANYNIGTANPVIFI